MAKTIVFIHGAWVTALCWEKFIPYFEQQGYQCLAPSWPCKSKSVEDQKRTPDPALAKLGITEIVDSYDKVIRGLSEPPFLIGHSFGGLFVQMLLDRGLGAAGVAIDSAPPKGVLPFYPSVIRSNLGILTNFGFWNKILPPHLDDFQYAFVHLLPEAEQRAAFDRYVVPESGRIFFQALNAPFNNVINVNFQNSTRAPLLLVAGGADRIVPAAMNRVNLARYGNSTAKTDFREFEGRVHWIIAQPGWEEVAGYINDWLTGLPPTASR